MTRLRRAWAFLRVCKSWWVPPLVVVVAVVVLIWLLHATERVPEFVYGPP